MGWSHGVARSASLHPPPRHCRTARYATGHRGQDQGRHKSEPDPLDIIDIQQGVYPTLRPRESGSCRDRVVNLLATKMKERQHAAYC